MTTKIEQLHRDLTRLRKILTGAWVQNDYECDISDTKKKKLCYCIMGGVGKIILNDPNDAENYGDSEWRQDDSKALRLHAVVNALWKVIPRDYRRYGNTYLNKCSNLITWNDKKKRTEQQVIDTIDKALAKAVAV